MRLGGWSRIGIVLSALYAISVAFIAYDSRPRLEYLESAWFSEAADAIAEAISKAEATEVRSSQVREKLLKDGSVENIAWLEKVAATPTENQKKFSAAVAVVNDRNKSLIADLPAQQRAHWLLAFVWWLGGTLFMFGAAWTVRWVYRGFRQNAA